MNISVLEEHVNTKMAQGQPSWYPIMTRWVAASLVVDSRKF